VIHRIAGAVKAVLPVDDRGDLPGLGVFGDIGLGVSGDDEDTCRRVAVVPDLVTTLRPERERQDVALRQPVVSVVHPDRGLSAQDHQQLLGAVVEVVDELGGAGLELPK
jgi:hypothetical protein